jgi:hypothetical protein
MKNADKSAYPAPQHLHTFETVGLTKREIFAMTAMQGILANRESNIDYETASIHAVKFADELLRQLE